MEQAKGTIKSILDATVELVTNSDDSFKKIDEEERRTYNAEVQIFVSRKKGGHCKNLTIVDNAMGMEKDDLLKAIEFAGRTSGFERGLKVRGFFGRGLKEAILALGEGLIISYKNNKLIGVRIWEDKGTPYYEEIIDQSILRNMFARYKFIANSGTIVSIEVKNDFRIPSLVTFESQITNHYQLRDINTNPQLQVKLTFIEPEKGNLESHTKIAF